ncbi:cytochrome P450 [Actinocrispum sp. NPDC049592]|uniref:cytochrome P450 family protein n=1 Tax=Actinocrispum sp. NPDC049592 TaxID=3154835 RepID=UPI00343B13A9
MTVQRIDMPNMGIAYLVTGYEEARAAFTDPRLCRDARNAPDWLRDRVVQNQRESGLGRNMLDSDPPDHTRLRQAVKRAFTPRRVESLRPRVGEITSGLLDRMAGQDELDLMDEFAFPLPVTVICDLLGLPYADQDQFRGWTARLLMGGEDREASRAASHAIRGYLEDFVAGITVEDLPEDAQPDLTHALIRAGQLDHDELVSMLMLLLIAGHETTVNLIGTGMVSLFTNPAQLELLLADLSLVPQAVEEMLRFDGPIVSAPPRIAAQDLTLGGTDIPAGSVVAIALPAANRDPARFDDPDFLDLTRTNNAHLAFGHGTHFCLGAALARMEAEIAFTALLTRFPGIGLAVPWQDLTWRSGMVRALNALPVRLKAA